MSDRLVKAGPFTFSECMYDKDADVLYLNVGGKKQALTLESPEGHLVRVGPVTEELVGITVLSVKRILTAAGITVSIPRTAFPKGKQGMPCSYRLVTIPAIALAFCLG